jgi:hypothetical protein
MTTFAALYRGRTVGAARLVAVSCDPLLVGSVASQLLRDRADHSSDDRDPVLGPLAHGRRAALRVIVREVQH